MEAHINKYRLNKEYILTTSILGNIIRISCKDKLNEKFSFSRDFSLEELKKVDDFFNKIQTPLEGLDFIDKALKKQKVGIYEEKDSLKVVFYVETQGNEHQLEIALGGDKSIKSKQEDIVGVELNINQDKNLEQNEINNNISESIPIISSDEKNENNNDIQMNTYDNNINSQINISESIKFNENNELVEENKQNFEGAQYDNTYQELNNQYLEGIDSTNIQLINGGVEDKTNIDFTSNYETGKEVNITGQIIEDNYFNNLVPKFDANSKIESIPKFTIDTTSTNLTSNFLTGTEAQFGIETNTNISSQITEGLGIEPTKLGPEETIDITSQFIKGSDINKIKQLTEETTIDGIITQFGDNTVEDMTKRFTTDNNTDLTSQFLEGDIVETATQLNSDINNIGLTTQFAEGHTINKIKQFPTDITTIDLTNQFVGDTDADLTRQFPTDITNTGADLTTQLTTDMTIENLTNQFVEGTGIDIASQFNIDDPTSDLGFQIIKDQGLDTRDQLITDTPHTDLASQIVENHDVESKAQFTTDTITTELSSNFLEGKGSGKESKFEIGTSNNEIISSDYQEYQIGTQNLTSQYLTDLQDTTPKDTDNFDNNFTEQITVGEENLNEHFSGDNFIDNNSKNIDIQSALNEYKEQSVNIPIEDNNYQYLGSTNETIQTTTNTFTNQLQQFESPYISPADDTTNIFANTKTISNKLNQTAQERTKITTLVLPLIKEAPESLTKNDSSLVTKQLGEIDSLRVKLDELNEVKSHFGDLDDLMEKVGQINILKKQIDDLANIKIKSMNLGNIKEKIDEFERIRMKYEQELKNLRETKSKISLTHSKCEDLRNTGLESSHFYFEDSEQICIKGEIIHNADELEFLTRKINKSNKKITLNLLYKAIADSDKASSFHSKCDEAESTLVLIETDKGRRFGGFTTCSWAGDCIDKKDEDAFIFSLDKMKIYENIPGEDAIGCYQNFGPIFLGCQIRIYDNAFTKGGSTFEKGMNYNTEEDFELTGGEKLFKIKDIEVYEVIPE